MQSRTHCLEQRKVRIFKTSLPRNSVSDYRTAMHQLAATRLVGGLQAGPSHTRIPRVLAFDAEDPEIV